MRETSLRRRDLLRTAGAAAGLAATGGLAGCTGLLGGGGDSAADDGCEGGGGSVPGVEDWPQYRRDAANTGRVGGDALPTTRPSVESELELSAPDAAYVAGQDLFVAGDVTARHPLAGGDPTWTVPQYVLGGVTDDVVVVCDPLSIELAAVDRGDGSQVWHHSKSELVGSDRGVVNVRSEPTVVGDTVVTTFSGETLRATAHSVADGSERWTFEFEAGLDANATSVTGGAISRPACTDSYVFAAEGGQRDETVAIDLETGEEAWRATGTAAGGGTLVFHEGTVYHAFNNTVVALDGSDGSECWRASTDFDESPAHTHPATPAGSNVVLVRADQNDRSWTAVTAFDRSNGDQTWQKRLDGWADGRSITAAGDRTVVPAGDTLSVFGPDGGVEWTWQTPDFSEPAWGEPIPLDGSLYVAASENGDGRLYELA